MPVFGPFHVKWCEVDGNFFFRRIGPIELNFSHLNSHYMSKYNHWKKKPTLSVSQLVNITDQSVWRAFLHIVYISSTAYRYNDFYAFFVLKWSHHVIELNWNSNLEMIEEHTEGKKRKKTFRFIIWQIQFWFPNSSFFSEDSFVFCRYKYISKHLILIVIRVYVCVCVSSTLETAK